MKIALIYNRNQRVAMGERCQTILKSNPSLFIEQFNLKESQNLKPNFDLYLRIDDGDYGQGIPEDLHPYAWWIADTHLKKPFRNIKRNAKTCDYIFCCQKQGAEKFSAFLKRPVHWLPAAADEPPEKFTPLPESERQWDICFIGTTGKFSLRKVVLEQIQLNYPNSSFIGRAPYTELIDYYSKAKIVVNYPINNDVNMRIFEAMSAGTLVLTKAPVNNGFEEIFRPGENIVTFDDIISELKNKIDYYLQHSAERIKIASKGFELVKTQHTYRNRVNELFKTMNYDIIS